MSLAPGTRLGPYEVVAQIGVGGMGEVYRATDTKLGRDVALKILPDTFAQDQDRLVRFRREAQVLASLNHPNIAQIHGLEDSGATHALVMELVEGPTLADRIVQGPIPVDEALPIAKQIAEALEAAHEQGIIHRDLKPANIKVRDDGTVKVLDFGLAKAMEPASAQGASAGQALSMSPTITTPAMTQVGMILGTAAYMSPEQAKGRTVDVRSDIWAFGCVVYEMLTGKRAFGGDDVSEVFAGVIKLDPQWDALPADLPKSIRAYLLRCLQKDRRERIQSVGDLRLALAGAFEIAAPPPTDAAAPVQPGWRRALPAAVTAVVAVLVTGLTAWTVWPTSASPAVNRFAYDVPGSQTFRRLGRSVITVAPDGRAFAYNTPDGFYLREMGVLQARLLAGTEEEAGSPFFSPDGRSIGFYSFVTEQLKRVSLSGGAPVVIASASNPYGVRWETDGTVLFGQLEGIFRVPVAGGTPQLVVETRPGEQAYGPQVLPDGDSLLFTVSSGVDWDEAAIVVQSLSTGERTVLVQGGSDGRYLPTGHLVYAFGNGLFGARLDLETLTVSGVASLVDGVMRDSVITGVAQYGVSDDGTLVYVAGGVTTDPTRTLVWVDRQGSEEPLGLPPQAYTYPRISPDGRQVAVAATPLLESRTSDIFTWDLARELLTNLTADQALDFYALWTPDGERVIFTSERDGLRSLYWIAVDGTGEAEALTEGEPGASQFPHAVSPDGSQLVFRREIGGVRDLRVLSLVGDREIEDLIGAEANDSNAELSPNGRWMAYQSNRSGRNEIYVSSFPNVAGRQLVSIAGGTRPAWARSGRELFYLGFDGRLMSVPVETDPGFTFERAVEVLNASDYFLGNVFAPGRIYDVAPDGRRFLFVKPEPAQVDEDRSQPRIVVVQHWFEELKRLVPVP